MSRPVRSRRPLLHRPPVRANRRRALLVLPALLGSTLALVPSGPADGATQSTSLADTTPTTPTTPVNPTPPKVTTGTAEAISSGGATLTATLTAGGAPTTYRFHYGTTNSYGLSTAEVVAPADAASATVKVPVTGLTVGTTYHFRITATNDAGTVQGTDRTFTTLAAPKAPTISTQAASRVTSTGAQLNSRVNPQGQATTVRFEWGLTTAYGNVTTEVSAGSGKGTVSRSRPIAALQPGVRYHYRAIATNPSGTVVGKDRTVTASRGLTSVAATLSAPVMPWNGSLVVSGQLNGAAPSGVKVELLRQDHPFTGPYRRVLSATTNASGVYAFRLTRVFSAVRVRVRVIGSSTLVSPELPVASALLVRLQVGVRKARTTRLRGTLYPASTGAFAMLQRQTPAGRWIDVRRLRLTARPSNRASFRTVIRRIGRDANYRVTVDPRDGARHVVTSSRVVTIAGRKK